MAHWQCVRVYARQAMCILPHPQIRGNMPAKLYGYLDPTRWMQGAADPTPMTVSSVWGDDVGNL